MFIMISNINEENIICKLFRRQRLEFILYIFSYVRGLADHQPSSIMAPVNVRRTSTDYHQKLTWNATENSKQQYLSLKNTLNAEM